MSVDADSRREPCDAAALPALVSVLVRSMQRSCLAEALDSVARQADQRLEVVLVNAAGGRHDTVAPEGIEGRVRLVNQDGPPLGRPQAANLALDHAHGQFLLFLDDDDLIDAGHIERLRTALLDHPAAPAAYAGVRLVGPDGQSAGVLDEPFDRTRLLLANYLPIHAVMFRRQAVVDGVRFDESLPVYEDWDFWRQLSLQGDFVHVAGVSASYRLVGDSGLSASPSRQVTLDGRARFYSKWAPRLTDVELDHLATAAERHRAGLAAQAGQLKRVQQALDESRRALEESGHALGLANAAKADLSARVEGLERTLESTRADHAAHVAQYDDAVAGLHARLATVSAERQQLQQSFSDVIGSRSWRLTAPLRALRTRLRGEAVRGVVRRLARAAPVPPQLKTNAKVWLSTGGPWSRSILRWLGPSSKPPAAAAERAPQLHLDKEAVRAQAERELDAFLLRSQTLQLRRGDGHPRVSVVVVLYNQAGLSLLCLQALAASVDVGFETIIVDNASTDRMPQLLERIRGAKVLRQDRNLGFLRAVNLAADHAVGEVLLLLNNDAVVEPATLAHAVARLDAEPGAGAVGGPIMLWDGSLQEAGSIIWRDGTTVGHGRGDSPDAAAYRFVRDVDYCSGAFLMLRRALFEQLGRFDERYAPAYYEETDLCVGLWQAGHRVVYDPLVRIKHFEFASDVGSDQALALQARNRALFVAKRGGYLSRRPPAGDGGQWLARQILQPGKRRVLLIDDRVPVPALGRGYPRASMLARAICRAGHHLTYYPLQVAEASAEELRSALDARIEVMLDEGLPGLPGFLAARAGSYDLILVSRPHNWEFVQSLKAVGPQWFAGAQLVYDAEALFSLREIERARVTGRALSAQEAQALLDRELALSRQADRIVAVSDDEAGHYRSAGCREVVTLGHCLAPSPSDPGFEQRAGFLFVGAVALDDCPNGDSLLWFARQVWPQVTAALGPAARLHIVGVCESPAVRDLASDSIRIHGRVADLSPFFDTSRVFIVPTRFAAGLPHKAHEAASRGLPMVVTPLIARQLGWDSQELVVADSGVAFAAACLHLHQDAPTWTARRAALLAAVARDCSAQRFEAAVQEILR